MTCRHFSAVCLQIMMSFTLTYIMTAYGSWILINEVYICINGSILLIVAVWLEFLMIFAVLWTEESCGLRLKSVGEFIIFQIKRTGSEDQSL